eukprot:221296-Pelagomonas_calceolata.AAC.3
MPVRCAGGSQGDIYQIRKTVEELNAIYQVRAEQQLVPLAMLFTLQTMPLTEAYRSCSVVSNATSSMNLNVERKMPEHNKVLGKDKTGAVCAGKFVQGCTLLLRRGLLRTGVCCRLCKHMSVTRARNFAVLYST